MDATWHHIVFVTHDVDEAIFLSDRIVVMQGNPGRIIEILEVHLGRPRDQADFRGEPETMQTFRFLARGAPMKDLEVARSGLREPGVWLRW